MRYVVVKEGDPRGESRTLLACDHPDVIADVLISILRHVGGEPLASEPPTWWKELAPEPEREP